MGYRVSKQKSIGYSPYFLKVHQLLAKQEQDLEATAAQLEVFFSEQSNFRRVMPLAFRNLAIAQQRDKERYQLVRGGG